MMAGVGNFQGRLNAGHAAAYHQRIGVNGHAQRFQRGVPRHPLDAARDDGLGFRRGRRLVGMHPRHLFADGDQLHQVRIEPGARGGVAEGLFMQVRRTRRHHHPRQAQILYILLDQFLA